MSYQQRRLEYKVHGYNANAAGTQSENGDCVGGFQKAREYGNAAGFMSGGGYGGGFGRYSGGGGYYSGYSSGFGAGGGGGGFDSGYEGGGGYTVAGAVQTHLYRNERLPSKAKTAVYDGRGESSGVGGESSGGRGESSRGGGESSGGHGDPSRALVPSSFPPDADPKFIECLNRRNKDRNGHISDQELMKALSEFKQSLNLRPVHLLMYMFTGSKVVGPKEFVSLVSSLQIWKKIFEKYDPKKKGQLRERELRDALKSMDLTVSPKVLSLLMSKYEKSGNKCGIEYDYIECCVLVKGLTEYFSANKLGTASFTCDDFLLSVLPFIIAKESNSV